MRSLILTLLPAALAAQIPTDAVLVLETTTTFYTPNWRLVDPFGGGWTIVHNQSVWTLPSPTSLAVDPVDPRYFFFQTNPSSLAGTWRQEVGLLATAQQAQWGPWQQGNAERVACGPNHVFTLQNGTVTRSARTVGGGLTTLFTAADAVDIAAAGTLVLVATNANGTPSPVLEYDLASSTQRT
ncbi:MAG: hypothetical protein JNK15_02355, partial [Planctomycetes bacterium]|nr:hypothetical protein [Planctomycetota bacterium]